MSAPILKIEGISLAFGGLKAVSDFHLSLFSGNLQGLIGPNGAGKTTVFNLLTGVYQPDTGTTWLDGNFLNGKKPYQIAKLGLTRTFQNIRLFPNLTVLDNIRIAYHLRTETSLPAALIRTKRHRQEERKITEVAKHLLDIMNLSSRGEEQAKNLPYGDQRRLEIARALATQPKVLLLDEPAAGMHPAEKLTLCEVIQMIRKEFQLTIFLIEHDMGLVMNVCEKITVMDYGEIIAIGTPAEIQSNPKVIEAYLGEAVEPIAS